MKVNGLKKVGVVLGVVISVSLVLLPDVRGELVYDNSTKIEDRPEDRNDMKVALTSSQKALTSVEQDSAQGNEDTQRVSDAKAIQSGQNIAPIIIEQRTTAVSNAAASSNNAASSEALNFSKTELLRRERMREEVKNEDVLQERLEELRLRDEQKRTDQILVAPVANNNSELKSAQAQTIQNGSGNLQIQTESVVAPLSAVPSNIAIATATSEPKKETENKDSKMGVSLSPKVGMSTMTSTQIFKIDSRYSAGVGLGVDVSDHVSLDVGYSYNEYGVSYTSYDPYFNQLLYYANNSLNRDHFDTVAMKQNVIDAGLKLHVLGLDSRIRPFIGGGGAYSKSYINYDERVIQIMNQSPGWSQYAKDYEASSFLGYLSTGLDVKVGDSISIGATFKYYKVLSARENQPLNPNGMYGGYNNGYYPGYYPNYYGSSMDYEKSQVAGSLARSCFYTITGGVSFSF